MPFPLLRSVFRREQKKNFILALLNEISANLEKYLVIEQRQFITMDFEVQAWEEARHFTSVDFAPEVEEYAREVERFNAAFADCRAFEEHYSSSIDQKTRANAEVLHAKKEALLEQFNVIRPKIEAAQKAVRAMLS
ncbi:MAG: hypothetical protein HQL19_00220 [Candidatus Omnitrophica bacterium]|nr:hypothetical protein [Candidatus Omnitrophota bacterium]